MPLGRKRPVVLWRVAILAMDRRPSAVLAKRPHEEATASASNPFVEGDRPDRVSRIGDLKEEMDDRSPFCSDSFAARSPGSWRQEVCSGT